MKDLKKMFRCDAAFHWGVFGMTVLFSILNMITLTMEMNNLKKIACGPDIAGSSVSDTAAYLILVLVITGIAYLVKWGIYEFSRNGEKVRVLPFMEKERFLYDVLCVVGTSVISAILFGLSWFLSVFCRTMIDKSFGKVTGETVSLLFVDFISTVLIFLAVLFMAIIWRKICKQYIAGLIASVGTFLIFSFTGSKLSMLAVDMKDMSNSFDFMGRTADAEKWDKLYHVGRVFLAEESIFTFSVIVFLIALITLVAVSFALKKKDYSRKGIFAMKTGMVLFIILTLALPVFMKGLDTYVENKALYQNRDYVQYIVDLYKGQYDDEKMQALEVSLDFYNYYVERCWFNTLKEWAVFLPANLLIVIIAALCLNGTAYELIRRRETNDRSKKLE